MYMPVMVDIKSVVVFGGERGEGLRKTEKLAVYADRLTVVPEGPDIPARIVLESGRLPHVTEDLSLPNRCVVEVVQERATIEDVGRHIMGRSLVVSALSDRRINETISRMCARLGILCNIADGRELCSAWFMSLVDSADLLVAVSSKGKCPYYAKRLRIDLTEEIRRREPVAKILGAIRARVSGGLDHKSVLDAVYHDPEFTAARKAGEWKRAERKAEEIYERIVGGQDDGR